ncbi:MAG: filamentous hemagglutinin N-terminal domain-containing protein [Parachlamydiales bacterium]|nr:filamentous hemagglutinin N-terminal domain-containing protein [Parachlamydiales bacterium]
MKLHFLYSFVACPIVVFAKLANPSIAHGEAQFELDGKNMLVVTSDKAVINWKSFTIDRDETVRFIQPSSRSAVLNRITSSDPTSIMGMLQANGQVYLINPNGILIGSSGCIQTASFIGSTFDVLDEDFLNGHDLHFQGINSTSIVNNGVIEASHGDLVLISKRIENNGRLNSPNGHSLIGCGEAILYRPQEEERLFILLPVEDATDAGIKQNGTIEALTVEIKAAGNPFSLAVSHEGKIDALGVRKEGANIYLVAEGAHLDINGEMRAESGNIHIQADSVLLNDHALIDVSSDENAGSVFIRGPSQKDRPKTIITKPKALIHANSTKSGNGGSVTLWSDEMNLMEGTILARGGPQGGNGGFVEVSCSQNLFPKGFIDTRSPLGETGTLLLDPCAVTISAAATTVGVMPMGPPGACPMPAQTYTFPGLAAANINNADLVGYLTCNNVIIDASASGTAMVGSITVSAPVIWPGGGPTMGTPTRLDLIADGSITINSSIMANYTDSTTITAININAPTVTIEATAGNLNVQSISGHVNITAPTNLFLTGTAGDVLVVTGAAVPGSASNMTVNCGNLTATNTGAANRCVISGDAALNATITGDCDLSGDGGSQLGATGVGATSNVNIGGHLHITGGIGANTISGVGSNQGPVDLTVGQDIRLQGGSGAGAMNATAKISGGVLIGSTGNVLIRNATDIVLIGGSMGATDSQAEITTGDFNLFDPGGNGTISITCSGNVSMTGGTTNGCFAGIRTKGTVGATTNHISLVSTNPTSSITMLSLGGGATDANASIQTFEGGNITISNFGNLTMTGSSNTNPAIIQTGPNGGNLSIQALGTSTLNSFSTINTQANATLGFSGGNLSLLPMTGPATISGNQGSVSVNLTGALTVNAGTNVSGRILAAQTGGTANLNVTASQISMTGGTFMGMLTLAQIGTGDFGGGGNGEVFVTATGPGGITLNGGTGMNAGAFIATFGNTNTNHITINVTDPAGNLTLNATDMMNPFASAAILTGGSMSNGNITINVANDLIMTASAMGSPSFIHTNFSNTATAGSNILILAGRTINMGDFTNIQNNHTAGTTTLVVDNNFPTPPSSGPGQFILDSNATITTASASGLFIYTATPTQNSILGSINGPFLGVNLLVNGPNEQWGIYYPDNPNNVTGTPYTLFYKEGYVEPLVPIVFTFEDLNDLTRALNEAFTLWKTYDRPIYVVRQLEISSGVVEDQKDLINMNEISSLDLPSWVYSYFYRSQRNYNTLKLENRL